MALKKKEKKSVLQPGGTEPLKMWCVKKERNVFLAHHSDMFDGGEKKCNWQYHCRSAPKGRRSAPPRWSRDVYSGRRRRGRVPLCHRLLCRLTFQLVVIRSSPCLGASFPASVLRKSHENARICRRALLLRRFHGGEEDYPREGKLEEVNYQQIFTVAACPRFYPLLLSYELYVHPCMKLAR